jgi:hypothetical protein
MNESLSESEKCAWGYKFPITRIGYCRLLSLLSEMMELTDYSSNLEYFAS